MINKKGNSVAGGGCLTAAVSATVCPPVHPPALAAAYFFEAVFLNWEFGTSVLVGLLTPVNMFAKFCAVHPVSRLAAIFSCCL